MVGLSFISEHEYKVSLFDQIELVAGLPFDKLGLLCLLQSELELPRFFFGVGNPFLEVRVIPM